MHIKNIHTLGQLIKQTRKQQKLTQEALCVSAGVGLRFLRELEHGKETCHIGKVFLVIQMLGLKVSITHRGSPE